MAPEDGKNNRRRGPKPRGSGRPEGAPASAVTPEQEAVGKKQIVEEAKTKIDTAKTSPKKKEEITQVINNLTTPNNDVNKHLTDKANKDGSYTDAVPGNAVKGKEDTLKYKAFLIHATISNVIHAYKDDKDLIPVSEGEPSRYLIDKLVDKIMENPSEDKGLTEKNSSYIQSILAKAISSSLKIDNILTDALTKEQWDALYRIDPAMYDKVYTAVLEAAKDAGVVEEKNKAFVDQDHIRRTAPTVEKNGKNKDITHTAEEVQKLTDLKTRISEFIKLLANIPAAQSSARLLVSNFVATYQTDELQRTRFKKFAYAPLPNVIQNAEGKYIIADKFGASLADTILDADGEYNYSYGLGLDQAKNEFEEYIKVLDKSMPSLAREGNDRDNRALEAYDIKPADFQPVNEITIKSELTLLKNENQREMSRRLAIKALPPEQQNAALKILEEELADEKKKILFSQYFVKNEAGAVVLTDFGKREMSRAVYVTVNKLLGKITSTMNVEWRSMWDPLYEGNLQHLIEDNLFKNYQSSEITNAIKELVGTNKDLGERSVSEYVEFMRGLRVQYRNEISTRQNYFDLRNHIIKGTANPEQMAGFSKNFPANTKEAMFKGPSGLLFQLALSEFQTDLQARMAMDKNAIPADIFGSYFEESGEMKTPDLERIRNKLRLKVARIKYLVESEDPELLRLMESDPLIRERFLNIANTQPWEIERALILAPGFSLVDSMRSLEIIAQGSRRSDFKGLFNFAQYITIIGKWRVARGRQSDNSGGFEIGELFDIAIRTNKEHKSLMQRIQEKGWVPREVYESSDKGRRKNIEAMVAEFDNQLQALQNQEGDSFEKKFEDAFRDFALLGFYSRTGWRIEGFNDWYKDQLNPLKKEIDANDELDTKEKDKRKHELEGNNELKYSIIRSQVGAAACWFYDSGRAEGDAKGYLLKQLYGADYKNRFDDEQQKALFTSYHDGHEKEKKVIKALVGKAKHVEAMTVEEFIEEKRLAYKGMNFQAVMERSPYDFMMIMNQLEPKLNQIITSGVSNGLLKYTCWEYYFSDIPPMTLEDQKKKAEYIRSLEAKWGHENLKHIEKIARIWHDTYKSGLFYKQGVNPDNIKSDDILNNVDTSKAQASMYDVMTFALTQVKLKHKSSMTEDDFMLKHKEDDTKETKDFVAQSEFFKNQFLGENGLIPHFRNENEEFGGKKGEEMYLGTKGFFTQWSSVWEMQMGKNMFATTNELMEGFIFDHIDKSGPDVFVRLWGDLAGWNKAVDSLITLDKKLLDAGESHKLDKIFEVHKEIQTLEGMISKRGAQKHNRQIAFLVARYFQTDWHTRIPGANLLGTFMKGKDTALSTLHGEMTSLTMNNGAIHDYLHHLVSEGFIDEEDMEIILENVGADLKKFMAATGAPTLVLVGAAVIAGAILIKVLKEFMGSKK